MSDDQLSDSGYCIRHHYLHLNALTSRCSKYISIYVYSLHIFYIFAFLLSFPGIRNHFSFVFLQMSTSFVFMFTFTSSVYKYSYFSRSKNTVKYSIFEAIERNVKCKYFGGTLSRTRSFFEEMNPMLMASDIADEVTYQLRSWLVECSSQLRFSIFDIHISRSINRMAVRFPSARVSFFYFLTFMTRKTIPNKVLTSSSQPVVGFATLCHFWLLSRAADSTIFLNPSVCYAG